MARVNREVTYKLQETGWLPDAVVEGASMVMDLTEAGMSVSDIAARVNCSRQTIYAWRRKTASISPAIAENLSVLLDEIEENGEG